MTLKSLHDQVASDFTNTDLEHLARLKIAYFKDYPLYPIASLERILTHNETVAAASNS